MNGKLKTNPLPKQSQKWKATAMKQPMLFLILATVAIVHSFPSSMLCSVCIMLSEREPLLHFSHFEVVEDRCFVWSCLLLLLLRHDIQIVYTVHYAVSVCGACHVWIFMNIIVEISVTHIHTRATILINWALCHLPLFSCWKQPIGSRHSSFRSIRGNAIV